MPVPSYAVVPSYGRECVKQCLDSLVDQVDLLFLVQTRQFAIRPHPKLIILPCDPGRELNISEWWNMGIKAAAVAADGRRAMLGRDRERLHEWDVVVVNDDAIVLPGLVAGLSAGMRAGTADLAYPGLPSGRVTPITGWCFMLRGEAGIMADPQFRWWYGDNDIELQARAKGGAVAVPGCQVTHLSPGGHDDSMRAQIAADTELFHKKWDTP